MKSIVNVQGNEGPNWGFVPRNEGPWLLEELTTLANAVGAKFNVTEWDLNVT